MEIFIKDYIKEDKNCTPAFCAALSALKDGDTLVLDNKKYNFYPEGAFLKEYHISNNDSGIKPIAIPIINKKNITIDARGADLIFHGQMMPIVVDNSENITLKGFSIDYSVPFFAQATIKDKDESGILIEFDGKEFNAKVKDGKFCFFNNKQGWEFNPERALSLEFDENGHPSTYSPTYYAYMGKPKDHGFLSWLFKDATLEERGDNLIFMKADVAERHKIGNTLVMTYAGRKYPGILITESKDVTLENINLYYTAAMGIVAQTSENISLKRIVAEPRKESGRLISTNADATHFINCRGNISLSECKFVQMMDDASNIHGIYNIYKEKIDKTSIKLTFGHPQHKGIRVYRKGDQIAIIDKDTNETKLIAKVIDVAMISEEEMIVTLDKEAPEQNCNLLTENLSSSPNVHFINCESGYNRPRGFLISTRGKAIVENCKFYNMNSAIQISGEMHGWYESGGVRDVTIKNCDFNNSAYAGGVAISSKPSGNYEKYPFNEKLTIENNVFTQANKRICIIESYKEVIFKNNRFRHNKDLSKYAMRGEDGTIFNNCKKLIKDPVITE